LGRLTPTVEARLAFWRNIEDRLASSRTASAPKTPLALEGACQPASRFRRSRSSAASSSTNARADAELAGELRDVHAASVADHESLVDDFNVPVDDDEDAGPLPFGVTGHAE
jgi:hypothetical protein